MIAGWSLVFLMVIKVLEVTYPLSLFAYGLFLIGFTAGMTAVHTYVAEQRQRQEHRQRWEESL